MGFLGVWDTAYGSLLVLVLGTNIFVQRRQLAGGGTEPQEGTGKVDTAGKDLVKGGSV